MPWDCTCGAHIERDDQTSCAACGTTKASWTLVADKTRTLQVAAKKAPLYRGATDEYVERAAGLGSFELVEAKELVSLQKDLVRQLARLDLLPAPAHLLVVKPAKQGEVQLVPEVERGSVDPVSFPAEAGAEVRFLLVHGPGPLEPGLVPADVHVVDVTDAGGWAPRLGVAAATKRRTTLPISSERRAFVFSM